jgi:hypothetical protein
VITSVSQLIKSIHQYFSSKLAAAFRPTMSMGVSMTASAVGVTMVGGLAAKKKHSDEVDGETSGSHNEHEHGIFYRLGVDESLQGFNEQCETQRQHEHGVDQSSQYFGPCPAVRVLLRYPARYLKHNVVHKTKRYSLCN